MIYLDLFISFLQIGLFSFGGGYAAMPLIQNQVVTKHSWLTIGEFSDLVTISQMTPGPIAVNASTFVGIKTAGIFGAVTATLGCILPSCIIISIIAKVYLKYRRLPLLSGVLYFIRPAVIGLIAYAGICILRPAFLSGGVISGAWHIDMIAVFFISLLLLRRTKINPIFIMFLAGALHLLFYKLF